jgi:uncharacterized GH25 family protein
LLSKTPSAFQKYLLEEKISGIAFDSSSWMKVTVKEKYSRCIKSLLVCGRNDRDHLWNKVMGQRLELVLKANPYALKDKEPIAVKLFWNGKPLQGEWIAAAIRTQEGNIKEQSVATDRDGVAVFEVERMQFITCMWCT